MIEISAKYTINEKYYYILHGMLNGKKVTVASDGRDIKQLMEDGFILNHLQEYDDIEKYKVMKLIAFDIAQNG